MMQIAVLGSNGMLGHEFSRQSQGCFHITELNRKNNPEYEKNSHFQLTTDLSNIDEFLSSNRIDYLINCAGLIRQKIVENDSKFRTLTVQSNFQLPLNLIRLSEKYDFKVIQIGTDCVFSGNKGSYLENDKHDALDLYGQTKSAGEIPHPNIKILRASIVGIEKTAPSSLLGWLLSQKRNATVSGYTDRLWNGVTVMHFARVVFSAIASGILEKDFQVQHLIPSDVVSKFRLLEISKYHFRRMDILIEPVESGSALDMSLGTKNPGFNELLWKNAGYFDVPSVEEMIAEYATCINETELT